MELSNSDLRRKTRATTIGWKAGLSAHTIAGRVPCEILDYSGNGLFAAPIGGVYTKGQRITIRGTSHRGPFFAVGQVCWVGKSEKHQRDGVGIRLEFASTAMGA